MLCFLSGCGGDQHDAEAKHALQAGLGGRGVSAEADQPTLYYAKVEKCSFGKRKAKGKQFYVFLH